MDMNMALDSQIIRKDEEGYPQRYTGITQNWRTDEQIQDQV